MIPYIYDARIINLSKVRERCTLKLKLIDLDATINIDIHDLLCETLGKSHLSTSNLCQIFNSLPKNAKVSRQDGYWEIINERQFFSDNLSNIYFNK